MIALWMNKLWAYPLTMVVFAIFCVYQMRRYMHTHSIWIVVLTSLRSVPHLPHVA